MAVERQAEAAAAKLSASILARYHEEQIWSDKIRRMSTWGTWGLMGVNVLLFLIFQIGVEPWRRKRLVKGFEDKVMEALEREGTATGAAITEVEMAEAPPAVVDGDAQMLEIPEDLPDASLPGALDLPPENDPTEAHSASHFDSQPPTLRFTYKDVREWMRDLFSERQIVLRRLDLTTATLEGAAAGAAAGVAFVGVLVLLLRPR